ncbi:MAG TPA: hypothetical protein IAA83_00340 [Candidatus Avoscillospira avistercoris]|uniref:Uncharacterized protein n=1 Tax=Candidatus Avoscillospira avistercoris TaxID=2840707 RepID=A0A9D1JS86_9FIRM|nr:hypothetical protein [Candidatus Avoscillospira avistercoris]
MGTPFTKDMNIITNFLKDMDIIAALDDQPNDVGGLTAAELKAKFDEGGKAIQAFLNDTLIPEVVGLDATEASRKEAEQLRVASEQARVKAEQARVTAEQARVTAEAEREHAEYLRQSGETGRIQGENTRRTQEAGRAREELARVEAEQGRAAAESARVDAEAARAAAEAQRVDSTTGIVAQATKQAQLASDGAAAAVEAQAAARQSAEAAAASQEQAAASAQTASTDAQTAQTAASTATEQAQAAQSWAVGGTGTRPEEDHDNAKYWAGVAHDAAGGGVVSFHGRTGAVLPQAGDYTAEMVGAASLDSDGKVPVEQLPAIGGTRMCRLVVGAADDGWTEKDCDYLCDGVDDQAEIQAAIDALPEAGGEIRLLEGSYYLSGQFVVSKADVTLRGTPGATRLYAAYKLSGLNFFVRVTADRCTLSGLWLSPGNGISGGMACGVELTGKEGALDTVDLRNFSMTALSVSKTAEDCSVRFCRTSADGGMVAMGPRCTFYGCVIGQGGLLCYGEESLVFCNRVRGMNSTICGTHSVATNNLFDASNYYDSYGAFVGNPKQYGGIAFVGNVVKPNKSGNQFSLRLDGNENIVTGNILVQYGHTDNGTGNLVDGNLVTTGGVSDGV